MMDGVEPREAFDYLVGLGEDSKALAAKRSTASDEQRPEITHENAADNLATAINDARADKIETEPEVPTERDVAEATQALENAAEARGAIIA